MQSLSFNLSENHGKRKETPLADLLTSMAGQLSAG